MLTELFESAASEERKVLQVFHTGIFRSPVLLVTCHSHALFSLTSLFGGGVCVSHSACNLHSQFMSVSESHIILLHVEVCILWIFLFFSFFCLGRCVQHRWLLKEAMINMNNALIYFILSAES